MRTWAHDALVDPSFVRFAIDLVRSVPQYDDAAELQAIYSWVHSHIRFVKDPVGIEKLCPPQELLKLRAGDCDCISLLLGSLCLAIGYPARLVTVAANPNSPEDFSHVYVEVELPVGSGNWIALDAARPGAQFGVEPPVYFRKQAWNLSDDTMQPISGLGSYGHVSGMGDVEDWLPGLLQQVPGDIAMATGNNPYGSFVTPYTPGYGIPPAGYNTISTSGAQVQSLVSQNWPLIVGGLLLLLMVKK